MHIHGDGNYNMEVDHNLNLSELKVGAKIDVIPPWNFTLDGINVREKSADFISNPVLSIRTDIVNNRATLSLTWDVRTSGSDENGNRLYIIGDDNENRTETLTRQVQL